MAVGSSRGKEWDELFRIPTLRKYNYTCVYCGREANEADHIIPKSKGGKDELNNLVAACKKCNAGLGNKDKSQVRVNWYDKEWLDSL